jgi:carbon-monoxide dehydrogenase small subunit
VLLSEESRTAIHLKVNGRNESVAVHPLTRLLDVIREDLRLTGTKEGCGEGECGACAVLLDGEIVNSCLIPILHAEGSEVTTIEGLSSDARAKPLQDAFVECGGAQCGVCTPGMIVAAWSLLERNPNPSDDELRSGLAGNLCRCTGYMCIFRAVQAAAHTLSRAVPK